MDGAIKSNDCNRHPMLQSTFIERLCFQIWVTYKEPLMTAERC